VIRPSRLFYIFAVELALILGAADLHAQQSQPVEVVSEQEVARVTGIAGQLRQRWPGTGEVVYAAGRRIEFRDGKITLGKERLAELARVEPIPATPAVLTFLLSHEAWHSVQAALLPAFEYSQMREDTRLECEADAMGGAAAYRLLSARLSGDQLDAAFARILDYVEKTPANGPLAYRYLSPDDRQLAIETGWNSETRPSFFGNQGFAVSPDRDASIRLFCRQLSGVSDGAIGWLETQIAEKPGDNSLLRSVTATNEGDRPIEAHLLGLIWEGRYGEDRRRLRGIHQVEVLLQPKEVRKIEIVFDPAYPKNRAPAGTYNYIYLPKVLRYSNSWSSVRYVGAYSKEEYCIDKMSSATKITDRVIFSRLGLIADAAIDDFSAIRSSNRVIDSKNGRNIGILPAFQFDPSDTISIREYGASQAYLGIRMATDEQVITEYRRIRSLIVELCGPASIADLPQSEIRPDPIVPFTVNRFGRHASLTMYLSMMGVYPREAGKDQVQGGSINFSLDRRPVD
jgi:hypothetical protein